MFLFRCYDDLLLMAALLGLNYIDILVLCESLW